MPHLTRFAVSAAALVMAASPALAAEKAEGDVRIATWNIENWKENFQAMRDKDLPAPATEEGREARRQEEFQNAEDNWEIAQVLLDPMFAPDVLVFQEGCSQQELDAFADEWLGGQFPTRVVFDTNSDRGQTLGLIAREGFTIVDRADDYHQMPDEGDLNPRSDFLFARGPGFALIRAPGGGELWVGTTHQKSKGGNSVEVTKWRAAEATATHGIVNDLARRGPAKVVILGDMNDELGLQEYEQEAGGDVTALMVTGGDRDASNDLVLLSRPLAQSGAVSYSGYWRDRYRSFIDHVVATPALAEDVTGVGVFLSPWVRVASDHVPVYVDVKLDD